MALGDNIKRQREGHSLTDCMPVGERQQMPGSYYGEKAGSGAGRQSGRTDIR